MVSVYSAHYFPDIYSFVSTNLFAIRNYIMLGRRRLGRQWKKLGR